MAKPKSHNKKSQKHRDFGISLEDATSELATYIEDAVDFVAAEQEGDWAKAERYYDGQVDLETVEGRARVVKTEVRDAVRNLMPSIMRILMQCRRPVNYIPTSITHAAWVEQQAEYITQLFYRNGGYLELYQAVLEALKLKIGVMKVTWEPDPRSKYVSYTGITYDMFSQLTDDDSFEMDEFESYPSSETNPVELYDVSGYRVKKHGHMLIQAVPNYEFFISRNVNSIEMALDRGVHGQKALITVAEAQDMGLDYDDWASLDDEDPEQSDFSSSSTTRRGYNKNDDSAATSQDLSHHQFTLYEVYARYDLKGTGRAQTYRFYLGGSGFTYLGHEEVNDSPYSIITPIPIPHTVYGHSIPDLTINEQDTSTSLLRAVIDNAHAVNGARIAADPTKTNFDDLLNNALNSPIRKRAGDTLQVIQIPFTGQGTLGTLQYLDQDIQNKVGVTKAAQGLDPDAMQSTDKNAVMNTIMTAQGQAELMVRNIIETGLVRVFRLALRISSEHMDPQQIIKVKGKYIPVDLSNFDPEAAAEPNVGIGTSSPQQRISSLNFIYQEQQKYMQQFGPNNPFTSFAQMYNTLEDLLEAQSIHHVERYFNIVTPGVEKQWAQAEQKRKAQLMQQQQQQQPMDPSKAYLQIEKLKSDDRRYDMASKSTIEQEKLRLRAIELEANDDLERDKLTQDRVIKITELGQKELDAKIKREQQSSTSPASQATTPNQVDKPTDDNTTQDESGDS